MRPKSQSGNVLPLRIRVRDELKPDHQLDNMRRSMMAPVHHRQTTGRADFNALLLAGIVWAILSLLVFAVVYSVRPVP